MSRRTRRTGDFKVVRSNPSPAPAPRVTTPSVQADEVFSSFVRGMEWDAKHGKEECDKWAERFATDPAGSLEWSRPVFEAAARHKVSALVLQDVRFQQEEDEYTTPTPRKVLEELRRVLHEEVVRKARWPEHSTSVPSNEMALCMNARRAEVLVKVEQCLAALDREQTDY